MKSWLNARRLASLRWRERETSAFAFALLCCAPSLEGAEDQPKAREAPAFHLPAKVLDAVTEKLPKYTPAPPKAPPRVVVAEPTEEDSASGEVTRLPTFAVTVQRSIAFSPNSFLNEKGKLALALKKYPGLGFGPLAFLNNAAAMEMAREDEEEAARASLEDEVIRTTVKDDARSRETIKLMREANARPNTDWLTRQAGGAIR